MRPLIVSALAGAAVIAAALPAAAAPWGGINARQAEIQVRIDRGVRDHSLTYPEARRLRMEAERISRLEARYRRDGLSGWERADLDRRLDALSARLHFERHDGDHRRW